MKSIKQLREQYQFIAEKEDKEQRKLTALVRAGLFDAKKLPMLKRALEKGVEKMTPAEKRILIDLLDSLMNQVISNEPVYMKVKRNVQSMDEEVIAEITKKPVTISDVPSIVVLKRKAVRVYPGGQQVGLYYSQQLDKYVTIPFGEIGMTEEALDEQRARTQSVISTSRRRDDDSYEDEIDRAINTDYENLTATQRQMLTPGKVATRVAMRGGSLPQIATGAILSGLLKRKFKNTPPASPAPVASGKPKQTKLNKTATVSAPSLPTVTASKNKPKISKKQIPIKNRAIKEAVISKLIERNQLDEAVPFLAAPAAVSGAVALGRAATAAAPIIARGVAAAAPVVRGALSRGKSIGKNILDKIKGGASGGASGKSRSGASGGRGRRAKNRTGNRRKTDLDVDLNTGTNRNNNIGSTPTEKPSYKKAIESPFQSQLKTNVSGPQYRVGGDAPVDAATARRYQKQAQGFYSQQNESVEVNLDGNIVEINSNMADKLVTVYESLNDNNKKKMIDMLMNEETQNKIIEFVTRY